MRNIFFEHSLKFEIDVIGYKNKGESIVFFLSQTKRYPMPVWWTVMKRTEKMRPLNYC